MLNLETAVQRLQEKIPEYDNIVHETELFMETIYAQGTDNEDEDEEDDVDPNEFYDACAAPVDISKSSPSLTPGLVWSGPILSYPVYIIVVSLLHLDNFHRSQAVSEDDR